MCVRGKEGRSCTSSKSRTIIMLSWALSRGGIHSLVLLQPRRHTHSLTNDLTQSCNKL